MLRENAPENSSTMRWASSGPTAGTVTLTGTRSRTGAGQPPAWGQALVARFDRCLQRAARP